MPIESSKLLERRPSPVDAFREIDEVGGVEKVDETGHDGNSIPVERNKS
jgi:hypothetical protein